MGSKVKENTKNAVLLTVEIVTGRRSGWTAGPAIHVTLTAESRTPTAVK